MFSARKEKVCLLFHTAEVNEMIREILESDFMDYRKVHEICMSRGFSKFQVRSMRHSEGIKTLEVMNSAGEKIWLWFHPQDIGEKYGG